MEGNPLTPLSLHPQRFFRRKERRFLSLLSSISMSFWCGKVGVLRTLLISFNPIPPVEKKRREKSYSSNWKKLSWWKKWHGVAWHSMTGLLTNLNPSKERKKGLTGP